MQRSTESGAKGGYHGCLGICARLETLPGGGPIIHVLSTGFDCKQARYGREGKTRRRGLEGEDSKARLDWNVVAC